jgi:predicted MFS family arabinose efflux permease
MSVRSASPAATVSGSGLWIALAALAAAGFSLGTDTYMLPALLPSLAADLHVPVAVAAQSLTVYALTVAIGAPLLTALVRRVERKPLLAACLGVLAISNLAAAIMPGFGWLVFTRLLAASAAATLGPIRTTTAGLIAPEHQRARAISIATAGQTAALVVGGPAGAWLAAAASWRIGFAAAGLVALLALAGVLVCVPRVQLPARAPLREQAAVLTNPRVVVGLSATTAVLCGIFVLMTFLRPVLDQITLLGAAGVAAMFAVYGVTGMVGNAAAGWFADRRGAVPAMVGGLVVAGLALAAISLLFLAGRTGLATAVLPVLIGLWGFGAWSFYSVQFHRLMQLAPGEPTQVVAWSSPATFLGVSLGAILGGLTVRYGTLALLGMVSSACMVVAIGCILATVALASHGERGGAGEVRAVQ